MLPSPHKASVKYILDPQLQYRSGKDCNEKTPLVEWKFFSSSIMKSTSWREAFSRRAKQERTSNHPHRFSRPWRLFACIIRSATNSKYSISITLSLRINYYKIQKEFISRNLSEIRGRFLIYFIYRIRNLS